MSDNVLILVVNCGSSSLKYHVFEMPARTDVGGGGIERIGEPTGHLQQSGPRGSHEVDCAVPDHQAALALLLDAVAHPEYGIVENISDLWGVGHRVVHGGEAYSSSVLIDKAVEEAIEQTIELAPLHNPANLAGIREARAALPGVPQVAVFDTAFHQTIPPHAYLYGLPLELYRKFHIRRYGFHGTSHRYVATCAVALMKRSFENTNVISCHLGNGASVTAIANGRSVDTSMGFTPLAGLVMGTRSGDFDPAIIFYLMERGYTPAELSHMLNSESGLLGLSELSNDLRDLETASDEGNATAAQAMDVYAHRIRQYIGAYAANLVKVDILVFTGGIGQHGVRMRERICHRLENLGIVMDDDLNSKAGSHQAVISTDYSPTAIVVVPTNEELQIAIDTYDLIARI